MERVLKIVYFAWVRERLGRMEEQVTLPANIITIDDLLDDMGGKDNAFAEVLADKGKLRFALNQEFVKPDTEIGDANELAIFPPVTGG